MPVDAEPEPEPPRIADRRPRRRAGRHHGGPALAHALDEHVEIGKIRDGDLRTVRNVGRAAVVRDLASRTSTVVQGAVEDRTPLTDGTTSTEGLLVRVDRTLAGAAAPQRIAIWPDLTVPSREHLADGSTVVAFVDPHTTETTTDGKPIPAYDFAAANGLLTVAAGKVRLQCRDSAGEPADASVLDEVVP